MSEITSLLKDGLDITDQQTRLKYIRLIQLLDNTEIVYRSRTKK